MKNVFYYYLTCSLFLIMLAVFYCGMEQRYFNYQKKPFKELSTKGSKIFYLVMADGFTVGSAIKNIQINDTLRAVVYRPSKQDDHEGAAIIQFFRVSEKLPPNFLAFAVFEGLNLELIGEKELVIERQGYPNHTPSAGYGTAYKALEVQCGIRYVELLLQHLENH